LSDYEDDPYPNEHYNSKYEKHDDIVIEGFRAYECDTFLGNLKKKIGYGTGSGCDKVYFLHK
jgi:hypothetical protein